MNQRRPLILAALALVVIAAALLLTRQNSSSSNSDREQLLYPDLKSQLDKIDAVRIFKGGDAPVVEVKRAGTAWTVAGRSGYPADDAKIRKFLIAAAEAKLVEEKTSNPDNYAALGVEDVSAAQATGHRVEIGGGTPVNLIVGKQAGRSSQYVRRAADKQSWQVNATLDVPTATDAWLRKDIIDIAGDRIQSVTVTAADSKSWSASKAARADTDFKVDGIPKGKELESPAAANSIGSSLAVLTLADVRKASELTQKPAVHATYRSFDGLVTEADGWVQDGKHYIALSTTFDEALAQRFKATATEPAKTPTTDTNTDANGKPETPPAAPERNVAEASKTLNATLSGWAYEIPDYKYEAIFKPIDELLKKDVPLPSKK